ncbi:protein WVD2-like 7 [Mercurialis annua]|uniref:protein WVD2-like 7 n=1 Tax=Mercurialis annua TaxID=3986 RepID=UPI00215FB487|nr:protein WVD2-like 7 [Mercurialis annua]XP_050233941.1 protein WVD2-like 7 [Mercurialis annua]
MAGEFEEACSISFQTDLLRSGSISFGRFESEELCWERRSSFSHNKYLEEAEKHSKPGLVTEKKAYFEAHFKKKGMRLPGSYEGHTGVEYHNGNNVSEDVGRKDEDDIYGSSIYDQFDEGMIENEDYIEFDDSYEGGQFDNSNYSSSQYGHFDDESPEISEYHGECEMIECEREDPGVASSQSQMEAALSSADVLSEGMLENILEEEAEMGFEHIHTPRAGIKENHNDSVANVDESSIPIDPSPKSEATGTDETAAVTEQTLSPKLGAAAESKSADVGLKSQICGSQVQKGNCDDAPKTATKKQNRKEKESPQMMKSEMQSPQATIPSRRLLSRSSKGEDSESCHSRSSLTNKSEKDQNSKKAVDSKPSGSKKVEPRVRQSPNRYKQIVTSAKEDTRSSTASFSFKSDERAERRKEFYLKLEEKMHAKETEMNQIQAKTLEKTEAEMKKFRKSLNFKAAPMPSFYHTAASPGSTKNKAMLSKPKAAKIQQKSTSTGKGAITKSPLLSKSGNNQSDAGEPLPTNHSNHPEAGVNKGIIRKEAEKGKGSNLQKRQPSESGKLLKGQRAEGNPKMGNHRNSSEIMRKSIKGVGIGSNSGMGRVAVGVAS